MATNNSDPSFLDNAKEYAGNVASNAYNQTKEEFSRVSQNSKDRDWIVERESKSDNLTLSQKEQLKYISSADDAMKFVEAAKSGDSEGAEKLYNDALKSQGGAILSFAGDVATTALGGAAGKAAIKAAPKLFKGAAEVIGENIPSLKKYGNIFKSSADKADEALAAGRAQRAAAREERAQESIQRAQAEQQQARTARNSTQNQETPFRSNTTRATETVEQTVTPPPEQSIFGKAADWTKNKIVQGTDWVKNKFSRERTPKVEPLPNKDGLIKTTLKGMGTGAVVGGAAGEYYDALPDEEKASWREKAQQGVDWVGNAIENPGEAWEDVKEGAGNLLGDAASGALGMMVGKGSNPFKGISAGMGSLFAGGGSVGGTLNSMPSGGDSGMTGEGHFGSDNIQGTSAIEVLNKIYNILAKTYDTVNTIGRDVSSLTKSQSQQDAANDITSTNMQARQNEMGTASPIYGGGGGGGSGLGESSAEEQGESTKGFWSKFFGKVDKKAAGAAAASMVNPAKKAGVIAGMGKKALDLGKKLFKPAAKIGSTVVAAELLKGDTPKFEGKELNAKQKENYKKIVEEAQKQGLSEDETDAALALAWHESNFKENAKGSEIQKGMHKGDRAHGIYQYMAKSSSGWDRDDPEQNIQHGVSDLKKHAEKYGIEGAYAAHQAGEGALNPDGTLKRNSSDGNQTTAQYQKQVSKIAQSLKEQRAKQSEQTEVASAKPEINGTKLTGDTKRNPYFGQETTPFEENEEETATPTTVTNNEATSVTEHTTRYAPQKDMSNASPDEIREEELAQQAEELAKNPGNLTVDEINAKNSEISRERNNIEFNRINKENPSPYVETVENVTTANEHHVSPKEAIETSQYTTTTNKHSEVTTGGGVTTRTAEEYQPTELDKAADAHEKDPINNPDPLAKYHTTPIPGKPGYYMRHGKEVGPGDILEGRKDTATSAENNTTTKPDNGKSQVDLLNATADQMNSTKYEMLDEDEDTVRAKQQKFYSENPTATPVKNDDVEEQIAEIDRQKATLTNERNEIGQSGVNVNKQTMDKQLDRLSDIHTEMDSLNEQRNKLAGNQITQSAPKVAPQQQAQQARPQQQAQQNEKPSPAGTTKTAPAVRNDDPTIKMMEEGSMWSTNGGLMA